MRFNETYYSIYDSSIKHLVPKSIDLMQWVGAGVKHLCVVLDTQKNDQLIHFSGITIVDSNPSFNDLYEQIRDLTEDKLTMLVSLYNHVNGGEILEITNTENINGIMFEYLRSTNGYLIYHHQFERFLENEMGYEEQVAIELRKSWNKKVVNKKVQIMSNENFNKLENLMPYVFTFSKVTNI